MNKLILCLLIVIAIAGCYYDSEEYLFPEINNTCDTANVTYTNTVRKLVLDKYCISCHSNSVASGNVRLQDYVDVKATVDNGTLLTSITRSTNPMPKDSNPLCDCEIEIIKIWINDGAPEN